jgi:hypothetical protein
MRKKNGPGRTKESEIVRPDVVARGVPEHTLPSAAFTICRPVGAVLSKQLGLRLEAANGPVDYLVVEHVDNPLRARLHRGSGGRGSRKSALSSGNCRRWLFCFRGPECAAPDSSPENPGETLIPMPWPVPKFLSFVVGRRPVRN